MTIRLSRHSQPQQPPPPPTALAGARGAGGSLLAAAPPIDRAATANQMVLDGVAALRAGRLDDARRLLERAAQAEPRHPRAHLTLSAVLASLGDLEAAAAAAAHAVQADPCSTDAWRILGSVSLVLGRDGDARVAFSSLLACKPDDVEALTGLASIRRAEGNAPPAVAAERPRPTIVAAPAPAPAPAPRLPVLHGPAASATYLAALEGYAANPAVLVEINSRCNFHCHYCRSATSKRQKSFMPRKLFDRVLEQLGGITTRALRLHVDGEPTLHPEFLDMALAANRAGFRIALATNGSNLRPEYLAVDMGLVLNVSASPEELAKRTPIPYERYLDKITRYVERWVNEDAPQSLALKVYVSAEERVARAPHEAKKRFAREFIRRVGLDGRGEWKDEGLFCGFTFARSAKGSLSFMVQPLTEGGLYPNLSGMALPGERAPAGFGFCDAPWKSLAVLSDGIVSYCCVDVTGETGYTRPEEIWSESLKDLWLHHPAIERDRQAFWGRSVPRSVCRACLDGASNREQYLFPEEFRAP